MDFLHEIAIILVCLLFSAFFSGSETALLRVRLSLVNEEAKKGKIPAIILKDLLSTVPRLLSTILVGNNLVNIAASAVAAIVFVKVFGEKTGVILATVTVTFMVLIFSEMTPKTVAAYNPERVANLVALPMYILERVLFPITFLLEGIVKPITRLLGGREVLEQPVSEGEIRQMVRIGARTGLLEKYPAGIIGATLEASDTTVAEVMVPRAEIFAVSEEADIHELLDLMLEERYTRAPVYRGDIDHIVGIVNFKDLVALCRGLVGGTLRDITRPVIRVSAGKKTLDLLREMQLSFSHMAIVKDEFGSTIGLVTAEDILEEIVGEIRDEFDQEELEAIKREDQGTFLVLARLKVVDFNRQTGLNLRHPTGEKGLTVGGLFLYLLGRTAYKGDKVTIDGYQLEATEVSGIRVVRIRITPPSGDAEEKEPGSEKEGEDERSR